MYIVCVSVQIKAAVWREQAQGGALSVCPFIFRREKIF